MKFKAEEIEFSFEIGSESDVTSHYIIWDGDLYQLIDYRQAKKVNKRQCRKIFEHTYTEIKKALKQGISVLEMPNNEYDDLYLENDHLQLLEDGVIAEFIEIKEK